ncbi:lipase family protein [Nocardia carnea]|uniref:lipase family protein n=1 Tax=Nocardia carnea TaxID=37328 RepID=UPI002454B753|nr:lipase family protein [Nocardia carnea]
MFRQRGRSRSGARGWAAVAAVIATCITAAAAVSVYQPQAAAAPEDFYAPPQQFPAEPGAVIKTRPMSLLATLPTEQGWPGKADHVMYTSRLQDGSPVAVTGTFIDAAGPWLGAGPRPTVVISPGTSGQGDRCAMSKAFSTGVTVTTDPSPSLSANQELPSSAVWSRLGARVLVTDYIGLGTPGLHTYANRIEQAHAVLDGARAANNLAGAGPETPLVLWGYSQGGGGGGAAAGGGAGPARGAGREGAGGGGGGGLGAAAPPRRLGGVGVCSFPPPPRFVCRTGVSGRPVIPRCSAFLPGWSPCSPWWSPRACVP